MQSQNTRYEARVKAPRASSYVTSGSRAVYKTMYENASKITLNAMCIDNNLNKMAHLMFALPFFDVSGFLEVV